MRELLPIEGSAVNTCSLLKCQSTKVKLIPNLIAAVENNETVCLTEIYTNYTLHRPLPFTPTNGLDHLFDPTCTCKIIVNGYLRNLRIFVIYLPILTDHDYTCNGSLLMTISKNKRISKTKSGQKG